MGYMTWDRIGEKRWRKASPNPSSTRRRTGCAKPQKQSSGSTKNLAGTIEETPPWVLQHCMQHYVMRYMARYIFGEYITPIPRRAAVAGHANTQPSPGTKPGGQYSIVN